MNASLANQIVRRLFLAFLLLSAASAGAQQDEIRVAVDHGPSATYPAQRLGGVRYIGVPTAKEMLRLADPESQIRMDAATGVLTGRLRGVDFVLYRDRKILRSGDSIIEVPKPLLATRGQVLIPLASLERIMRSATGVETNLQELTSDESRITNSEPDLLEETPAASAPEEEAIPSLSAPSATNIIVIDPGSYDAPAKGVQGPETADAAAKRAGAEVSLRVAKRCREILLESNPEISVQIATQAVGAPEQRVRYLNSMQGAILVCLRVDSSPFSTMSGYRIFLASTMAESAAGQDSLPSISSSSPGEAGPYAGRSLQMAKLLDAELSGAGLSPALIRVSRAPLYVLRHATLPAVWVGLGFWTNDADRAKLNDPAFVESAARGLGQALLEYNRRTGGGL